MANDVRLVMVGIGKPSVGKELIQHLGIQNGEDFVYADPENTLYNDLDLNRGVLTTFFNPATPFSMRDRIFGGDMKELGEVLGKWKDAIYLPPKQVQAFNQGGTFIFNGPKTIFAHYDEATGAHADFKYVVDLAIKEATTTTAAGN